MIKILKKSYGLEQVLGYHDPDLLKFNEYIVSTENVMSLVHGR